MSLTLEKTLNYQFGYANIAIGWVTNARENAVRQMWERGMRENEAATTIKVHYTFGQSVSMLL